MVKVKLNNTARKEIKFIGIMSCFFSTAVLALFLSDPNRYLISIGRAIPSMSKQMIVMISSHVPTAPDPFLASKDKAMTLTKSTRIYPLRYNMIKTNPHDNGIQQQQTGSLG